MPRIASLCPFQGVESLKSPHVTLRGVDANKDAKPAVGDSGDRPEWDAPVPPNGLGSGCDGQFPIELRSKPHRSIVRQLDSG